jgi:cation:H+ antiporter
LTVTLFQLIAGLILLVTGAEALVRGSTSIALRLGITRLVIGLTIVAFGTGSPELSISIRAALRGDSGIALGNVVGSNITNIALILGAAAVVRPMRVRSELIRREMPVLIAVTLFICGLLVDGRVGRVDGLLLVIGTVVYTVFAYMSGRRDQGKPAAADLSAALEARVRPAWLDAAFILIGFLTLLAGAELLLVGATTLARSFGVSQVVIGLTIVAIGTSLPELATSVVAAARGEADIAFGNVIGSNILNILCVLGIAALIRPIESAGLRTLDVAVMLGSAVLLLPLMRRGSVLNRWEGAALLAGYVAYLYSLT